MDIRETLRRIATSDDACTGLAESIVADIAHDDERRYIVGRGIVTAYLHDNAEAMLTALTGMGMERLLALASQRGWLCDSDRG